MRVYMHVSVYTHACVYHVACVQVKGQLAGDGLFFPPYGLLRSSALVTVPLPELFFSP